MDYSSILRGTPIAREFLVEEFLSKGSYGEVYRIRRILDDKLFALKVFSKSKSSSPRETSSERLFRKEAEILRAVKSTHIVNYEAFFETSSSIFILMEYCAGGDLLQYMSKVKELTGHNMPEQDCSLVMAAILKALKTLHQEHGIMHRDIKPANILVRRSFKCGQGYSLKLEDICLADFGLSMVFDTPFTTKATKRCGTDSFNAPEQLLCEPYDMVGLSLTLVGRHLCHRPDSLHSLERETSIQERGFLVGERPNHSQLELQTGRRVYRGERFYYEMWVGQEVRKTSAHFGLSASIYHKDEDKRGITSRIQNEEQECSR